MARVNIYLPDELAARAREAGLNISRVTQDALRTGLARGATDRWLDRLDGEPETGVGHEQAIAALDAARDDLGAHAAD
jgi:post-segregation antitoxin (ccd killing protein)